MTLTVLSLGLGTQRATADQEWTWKLDPGEAGQVGWKQPKVEAMVEVRTWKTLVRVKESRNVDGWVLKEPHDVTGWVVTVDPVERWRPLVCTYTDWDCSKALRILRCESTGDPLAYNAGAIGLLQIHYQSHAARVSNLEALYDPATNIRVGHEIWSEQSWGPWGCRNA